MTINSDKKILKTRGYSFSKASRAKLDTCVPELQAVFNEVIKSYDCTIVCGRRTALEQEELYRRGLSKKMAGGSKHETSPLSEAVDVAPYPINWEDYYSFYHFAGFVLGVAAGMGVKLRWGGDWDGDNDLHDQTFMDLGHFEVVR